MKENNIQSFYAMTDLSFSCPPSGFNDLHSSQFESFFNWHLDEGTVVNDGKEVVVGDGKEHSQEPGSAVLKCRVKTLYGQEHIRKTRKISRCSIFVQNIEQIIFNTWQKSLFHHILLQNMTVVV